MRKLTTRLLRAARANHVVMSCPVRERRVTTYHYAMLILEDIMKCDYVLGNDDARTRATNAAANAYLQVKYDAI